MTRDNAMLDIGKRFLRDLDDFIAANYQNLRCVDISNIYFEFFKNLKEFRGTSGGFTGLSEFLVFRFLYHKLGGDFETTPVTNDIKQFVGGDICIGQSIPIDVGEKPRIRPDISLFHTGSLKASIEIKVYLTRGIHEVKTEIARLKRLYDAFPQMRGLLICFSGIPSKGTIFGELKEQTTVNPWFSFLILANNEDYFGDGLDQTLELSRIPNCAS